MRRNNNNLPLTITIISYYTYESLGIPAGNIASFTMMDMLDEARVTKGKGKLAKTSYDYSIINDTLHGYNVHVLGEARLTNTDSSVHTEYNDANYEHERDDYEAGEHGVEIGLIIGNPPYQTDSSGTDTHKLTLYNRFMDIAAECADEYVMITPARFLTNTGSTPKNWNQMMLSNPHYRIVSYYANSEEIFGNTVGLAGGIAISYYNNSAEYAPVGRFIADNTFRGIINRIVDSEHTGLDSIIYPQTKILLDVLYADHPDMKQRIGSNGKEKRIKTNYFDKYPKIFLQNKPSDDYAPIYGLTHGNNRCYRFIDKKYLDVGQQGNYDKYTVMFPKASSTGAFGSSVSYNPVIGSPNMGYTQSFIGVGAFDSEREAENCVKYMKTKFARIMLASLKTTQDNAKGTWANIPVQDFTADSDIDWTKTIPEIDKQLYKKYGLTDEETKYIEDNVQPMS